MAFLQVQTIIASIRPHILDTLVRGTAAMFQKLGALSRRSRACHMRKLDTVIAEPSEAR